MTETREQKVQLLEKHLSDQPNSPRFAELASYYLEAGRPRDALAMCDQGLAYHPFYTTGHLIKGRTLLDLNMRAEARREFEFVHGIVPNSDAVVNYLKQISPTADETVTGETTPVPALPETADQAFGIEEPPAPTEEPEAQPPSEQFEAQQTETAQSPEELLSEPPQGGEQTVEREAAESDQIHETQATPPTVEELFNEGAASLQTAEEPAAEESPPPQPAFQESSAAEEPPEAVVETTPTEIPEEESYEQYSERKRSELSGLENSMSLDEYLHGSPAESAPAQEPDQTQNDSADSEDPFAQLSQMAEESSPPEQIQSDETASTDEDPFAGLRQESPGGEPPEDQAPEGKDQIEEITEKLQNAKITPVINLSEKTPRSPDDAESPTGSGFVTPTLAEIYAKQGWYDDAIKAYKALAAGKPAEREKFEARIQELEELKKQQEDSGE